MTKKELKKEFEDLLPEVKPLFQTFIDDFEDDRLHTYLNVKKDKGYFVGTLVLAEYNALCHLSITKMYYVFPESADIDNKISIEVSWFDDADKLKYTNDYFADISNKATIEKTKILLEAAMTLAKKTHELERR